MTFLRRYVILIVGCIFLSTLVQTALPNSSLKKTLRFVLGLILAVIILTPFGGNFNLGNSVFPSVLPTAPPLSDEQKQKMEDVNARQTQTLFRQTMEQSIGRVIAEHGGEVQTVEVDCDPNGNINAVTVVSQDTAIPSLIAQNFDIPLSKIQLRAPHAQNDREAVS